MFNRFTKDFMQQEERNDYLLQHQQEWMRICIRNRASYIIKAINGDISRCCKILSPLYLFGIIFWILIEVGMEESRDVDRDMNYGGKHD